MTQSQRVIAHCTNLVLYCGLSTRTTTRHDSRPKGGDNSR